MSDPLFDALLGQDLEFYEAPKEAEHFILMNGEKHPLTKIGPNTWAWTGTGREAVFSVTSATTYSSFSVIHDLQDTWEAYGDDYC